MALWELRPVNPWEPWYDKAFGFIVRADTEKQARELITEDQAGNEWCMYNGSPNPWLDSTLTTCVELAVDGEATCIMRDFASA